MIDKSIFVSVVIPTYNRPINLKKTLDAFLEQNYPKDRFEIIVVDDGKENDENGNVINKIKDKLNIKYLKYLHRGPASARNNGIKNSTGDILAFTDDDCIITHNWLNEIVNSLINENNIAVYGPICCDDIKTYYFFHTFKTSNKNIATANLAVKKEVFQEIGFFDENFTFPWCEDVDFSLRIIKKYGNIKYNPNMEVFHDITYVSFFNSLRKAKFLEQEILLATKYKEDISIKKYIIRDFLIKRIVYFTFWILVPLQYSVFFRLLIGLAILWIKDFYELLVMKKTLSDYKLNIRVLDQFYFVFLHWIVIIVQAFYLIKGIIKFIIIPQKTINIV